MDDLISRRAAIDALCDNCDNVQAVCPHYPCKQYTTIEALPKQVRKFVGLDVMYPDPELCTYKEYTGKPYYSIKYIENGEIYVGYGTYNPEVLSRYLREYFMSSVQPEVLACGNGKLNAQPEIIRCKDCKYGSPNEVYGCRLEPFSTHDRDSRMYADDFCSRAERRTDETQNT